MADRFPRIQLHREKRQDEDANPGIQLFGRRFFADQSVPEFLIELLLVMSSTKRVANDILPEGTVFPAPELLSTWPDGAALEYAARARLNLKLFAFLGASKLDTRHETHRRQYRQLLKGLGDSISVSTEGTAGSKDVLRTLENLFLGFQGVGAQRTWCAQAMLPVCPQVLGSETIWNAKAASREDVLDWPSVLAHLQRYFSLSRHRFLARGGELLYLQICNAFRQDQAAVRTWLDSANCGATKNESNPSWLQDALGNGIQRVLSACPETLGALAEFIDTGIDPETSKVTDYEGEGQRFSSCGWCPEESWPEGYLFAIDVLRLCEAQVDPIDRLELLSTACVMQVLRSLCAQSARHVPGGAERRSRSSPLGYIWAVSDPEGEHRVPKEISRRCVNENQRLIHDALRRQDILEHVERQRQYEERRGGGNWSDPYTGANGADSRYGHKLFLGLAKRLGLIVPPRGPGARLVLNERLLQYLVLTLVRPGTRVTYETFKNLLYAHHGIAVDNDRLGDACEWCGTRRLTALSGETDAWLVRMLDAAGMLIRLSDSCSLVRNPFDGGA